ncbi:MAG: pyridoxine 5'-phosphate synthase [Desulfurivibrio sp.]|nr:pyridoxine 5'-phosphate synthase [Desulfurivibrio sp.]
MPVLLSDEQSRATARQRHRLRRRAGRALELCGQAAAELSILLVDDEGMRQLNAQYRGRDRVTNVLAFPQWAGNQGPEPEGSYRLLGDIVIAPAVAAREAEELGIDRQQRLDWLLIHGLLHLLGYEHETSEREAAAMEATEQQLLARLMAYERREQMTQLAINVDHVATLRQARGISEPDPVLAAGLCELAGATGIVVHLREDRRHIQDRDLQLLRQTVQSKLNLEMGAAPEIVAIALELQPDMVTLVPEKRRELTTEGGLDIRKGRKKLTGVIKQFRQQGIPVSLFIDPDPEQIEAAAASGATFVEIHTGRYCDAGDEEERQREFTLVADAAAHARQAGLRVNAGHGLNYRNTGRIAALDEIEELSIGHAVMARAIMVGLERAVKEMLAIIREAEAAY